MQGTKVLLYSIKKNQKGLKLMKPRKQKLGILPTKTLSISPINRIKEAHNFVLL